MKSYEHMGVMQVKVSVIDNHQKNKILVTTEKSVDCLWEAKVSEQVVEKVSIDISTVLQSTDHSGYFLIVTTLVVDATPVPRSDNKIKLYSISFS